MTRAFVLSGWFGRGPSLGMAALAQRLKAYADTSYHSWNDNEVIKEINATPPEFHIAVIGYSLGANQLGWIDKFTTRPIDLGVAYDPSRQSPLVVKNAAGEWVQIVHHYHRLLCYYHPNAWLYGGSRYVCPREGVVETKLINIPHLAVQFSEELHRLTIDAVQHIEWFNRHFVNKEH